MNRLLMKRTVAWQQTVFNFLIILLLVLISGLIPVRAQNHSLEKTTRMVINLLDYIGRDYSKAVKRGRIINDSEYGEMKDFTDKTIALMDTIEAKTNIAGLGEISLNLQKLRSEILQKKGHKSILDLSDKIKRDILLLKIIKIIPSQWPDFLAGKRVYLKTCASCHGTSGRGNGDLANTLDPKPSNFLEKERMKGLTPFQIYNSIRLGVPGTAMRPFNELSEKDVWNVAFFIKSLRYQEKYLSSADSLAEKFNRIKDRVNLGDVVTLTDQQLLEKLEMQSGHDDSYLAALRLHVPVSNKGESIKFAITELNSAFSSYLKQDYARAEDQALSAYLKGIEPNEQRLNAVNPRLVAKLEAQMNEVRAAIKGRAATDDVGLKIEAAKSSLANASSILAEQKFSFWFTFMLAASILLREGLEAFLIIIAILSVLKSLNVQRAAHWVHGGWIFAVVVGVSGWFFTDWLLQFGAQNREVMEGAGALFAVLMLLYIGFWLHGKTEARKWKEFVEGRITRLTKGNNLFGLSLISFVVVFREALETVLFLSALSLEATPQSKPGIWMGSVLSFLLVLILAWLALKFAKNIPIRTLFKISAFTMAVLAIILTGQGVHSLEESGFVSVTPLFVNIRFSLLGIYPTVQTILSQFIVLLITIGLWSYHSKSASAKKK